MKKRPCWLLAGLLLVVGLCTGCSRDEMESGQAQGTGTPLSATFEQGVARLAVSDANALSWAEGDAFTLFGVNANSNLLPYRYELSSGAGGNEAVFAPVDDQRELRTVVGVVYPTDYSPSMTPVDAVNPPVGTTLQMTLPHEITLAEGLCRLPMYAPTASTSSIRFKHLCGLLRVRLSDIPAGYSKLVLKASAPLSGEFTADLTVEEPVLESASTDTEDLEVSFPFPAGQSNRTFYVPLPVGTYATLTAKLQGEGATPSQVLRTWTNLTVRRAVIYTTSLRSVTTNATSAAGAAADLANAFATQTPADGETFQLDLTAQITTSSTDATLSVPQAGGSITALTFDAVPNTTAAPLRLETVGETATAPGASANTVVVAIPESTGGAAAPDMDIHMPTTTVELASTEGTLVTYGNVSALTATNTLVIGRGVTVNQLTVNGGVVHVKAGGTISSLLRGSGNTATVILIVEDGAMIPDGLDDLIFIIVRDIRELALRAVAKLGGTFVLTSDMELSRTLVVESDMTLDLGNYRLTPAADFSAYDMIVVRKGAALTINGGPEGGINDNGMGKGLVEAEEWKDPGTGKAVVVVNGGNFENSSFPFFGRDDSEICVKGGKIFGSQGFAVNSTGVVSISGGELVGGFGAVLLRKGLLEVSGGTLTSLGLLDAPGADIKNAVIGLTGWDGDCSARITGGTFIAEGLAQCCDRYQEWNSKFLRTFEISGGSFNDLSCLSSYPQYLTDDANVSITLTRDLEYPYLIQSKGEYIGIDLNGHTLKLTDHSANNMLVNVSFYNGTMDFVGYYMGGSKTTLSNVRLKAYEIGIAADELLIEHSTLTGTNFLRLSGAATLNDSRFIGKVGLEVNSQSNVKISSCECTGTEYGAYFSGGTIEIENSAFFLQADKASTEHYAALSITSTRQYATSVTLKGGEIQTVGDYDDNYPSMYVTADPEKSVNIMYDGVYFGNGAYTPKIEYGTTNITVNGKPVIEQDGQFVLAE